MLTGTVIQTTGASYQVQVKDIIYVCTLKGKMRLSDIKTTNPISIGDIVDFEILKNNTGIIVNIQNRKTSIVRKSTNLSKAAQTMAVNVDQILFVFTLINPETPLIFLDRLLTIAEYNNLPVIIVVNKTDLYDEKDIDKLAEILAIYNNIGYKIILTSILKNKNIEEIKVILKDRNTFVAGLSGVGKSSLINSLIPDLNLKTADISKVHLAGRHTTTFAKMIQLPFSGYIIDSPGNRAFGLINLKKENISHYFKEFFELLPNCKYYNCKHINEPDCAIKKAVEIGKIAESRYKSYLNIMFDENDKHRR
ncbi:MAG: ribosome small subunit-dependent GTPase A [Bacteroidales bacterium]|jgi:ribosome biogenesis GTPase|nr:ribosome small subunit-dependent GTPase A [Bacteroidales bacterium]